MNMSTNFQNLVEVEHQDSQFKLHQDPLNEASSSEEKRTVGFKEFLTDSRNHLVEAFEYHKVPLCVLLSLLLFPKLILLWIAFVLVWTFCQWLYPRLLPDWQRTASELLPQRLTENRWFKEIDSGVSQVRPFIFAAFYFFCVPLALVWMGVHWLGKLFVGPKSVTKAGLERSDEVMFFTRNKELASKDEENNFFHSPVFSLTALGIFACGLPAVLTYFLYTLWGIDAILGYPSSDPRFSVAIVIIGFYLMSLAWGLMAFFFRAWFTFPLNFLGKEEELKLDSFGIKTQSKNWFETVLTWNCARSNAEYLDWNIVKSLRYESTIRFYPLPVSGLFNNNSALFKLMNRIAFLFDSIVDRVGRAEIIRFSTAREHEQIGNCITLNLSDLSAGDRARMFYATRRWAPHVFIDDRTQEKLLGSAVLREPQYTQIWFDLLTSKPERKRLNVLKKGELLADGEFEILEKIATGGQATTYLARRKKLETGADGVDEATEPIGALSAAKAPEHENCVLKEFVLSSSDVVGALLESAREFETEASLLTLLKHPRIVKMLDFFSEDRRAYLVLEHVKGVSLRKLVQENGPLPEKLVIELGVQMCEVLDYLHSQTPALVHRDFSPDNIIYSDEKGISLIDFSLSGSKQGQAKRTVVGKHSYTPPEQFREQSSSQSDIYALGASLYFLLSGKDPKPISCSSPRSATGLCSEALNEIVQKATKLDLEERYTDVKWILLDLRKASGCDAESPAKR